MKRDLSHGSARVAARSVLAAACASLALLLLAAAIASATPTLSSSFDGSATPAGAITPTWLSVDESTGDVYVIDSASDVVDRFSATGTYLGQMRGSDTTSGSFGFDASGDDIAVDNSGGTTQGYVYVVGEQNPIGGRISAFDAAGRFRWQLATPFPANMCGVAVDPAGHLWTTDSNTGAQQRSTVDGSPIGSPQQADVTPCSTAFDSSGVAYLAQPHGVAIQFSPDITGTLTVIDGGQNTDVATDSTTNEVYLNQTTQIAIYDSSGVAQTPFDSGQLAGVTVDGAHGSIFVSDGANNRVEIWSRGSGVSKPYVRPKPPTDVTGTTATINATVNAAGDDTTCRVKYVTDAQFAIDGYNSALQEFCASTVTGTSDVDVAVPIGSGLNGPLTPDTTYHYRVDAINNGGLNKSADNTFTTTVKHRLTVVVNGTGNGRVDADSGLIAGCTRSAGTCSDDYTENSAVRLTATPSNSTISWSGGGCSGSGTTCDVTVDADKTVTVTLNQRPPTVAGESVTGITQTAATLGGTANPNGAATTCEFEYGTTVSYGTRVPVATNPGSGTSAVAVRAAISGLSPNTDYHYRLDCTNTGGTTNGTDHTFRTLAIPPPTVTTGAASGVTQTAATVAGSVNPNGFATTCRFEYGTSASYGSSIDCAAAPGSGSSAVAASAALAGLSPGTTYHFRIVATNGGGTSNGADATFTTAAAEQRTCLTDASLCHATLGLTSPKASVKGSTATVGVSCAGDVGARCSGSVTFKATVSTKVKKGRKTVVKRKTITVGSASFDLAAGAEGSLSVKLSSAARSALKKGKLVAKATGLDGSVTFPKAPAPRRHKKKR